MLLYVVGTRHRMESERQPQSDLRGRSLKEVPGSALANLRKSLTRNPEPFHYP